MTRIKKEVRQIMVAVAIALGAALLVIAFVVGQEPARAGPAIEAPDVRPVMLAPENGPRVVEATPAPPPQTSPRAAPSPQAESKPAEAPVPQKALAKKPPPPKKAARPSPPPRRLAQKMPKPPSRPARKMVAPARPRGDGFKVKFRSLAALENLVEGDHVSVVLEYGDGNRLLLPRELDGELVTIDVPDSAFARWVEERRVSELVPTRALMDRLQVHARGVRYLAVLSGEIRDAIAREADRAKVDAGRSVMVIDEERGQPEVSVLLARR